MNYLALTQASLFLRIVQIAVNMENMLANPFTCTGPYAILILAEIKRSENRSMWPSPSDTPSPRLWRMEMRAAISHVQS